VSSFKPEKSGVAGASAGEPDAPGQDSAGADIVTPAAAPPEDLRTVTSRSAGPGIVDSTAQPGPSDGKRIAISPRARKLAERKNLDYRALAGRGSGPGGRIIEKDVEAALSGTEPLTPAASAMKAEGGLAAPARGTGIGGRVGVADQYAAQTAALAGPAAGQDAGRAGGLSAGGSADVLRNAGLQFPGNIEDSEVKGVRKIVGERMHASLQSTAQLTMHTSADARYMLKYRQKLKESDEDLGLQGITINDLVLYAAIKTLARFPALNAHFLGEKIRVFEHIHAAFAVDTPRGLMVPVVRFADLLSLKRLAEETKRLSAACLAGNINPDELKGGSITVTNLGVLGIEMFTPVLNAPQVAILGVCAVQPKPVMKGEEVAFVPHVGLSLTIDHQAVDGAPAARFLKELAQSIANFDLALAG
jgi:pyruvate dehydrogenase E2 component (dihydrolipoamide acetyltransferase)